MRSAKARNETMKRSRVGGGGNAARKRPIVKHVTNNITNNINNYFAPQSGSAPAPEAQPEAPPNLFPEGGREVRAPHNHGRTYRSVLSTRSGKLFGDCGHCTKTYRPITYFAPEECIPNVRSHPQFLDAFEAYEAAYAERDLEGATEARATIGAMRTTQCPSCRRTNNKPTGEKKACKEFYEATKREVCERQNGCMNPDCVERGPLAYYVLEGDHVDPETKVRRLSDWTWWGWNGGVAAMKLEVPKLQWPCSFCHKLEKTSNQANRCGDPDLMPDGKNSKHATDEEVAQYKAKHYAKNVYPKQVYVDSEKSRRGTCLHCTRPVTPETVFAFDFDHRDERSKMIGKDTLAGVKGGVGGIVANSAKRASLENIKDILDAEMAKCDLLCANCHHRKTWGYPVRTQEVA